MYVGNILSSRKETNMKILAKLQDLERFLNQYSAANMVGKEFDCTPVRNLCKELKKEAPEKFECLETDGTDHELMVSVSNFFMKLLNLSK